MDHDIALVGTLIVLFGFLGSFALVRLYLLKWNFKEFFKAP